MKMKTAALAVALATLGLATQAAAVPVTVVYQGFVDVGSGSYDYSGLFGGAGDLLDGDAITATFVYDTSLGFETTDGASFDELDGGSDFADGASPVVYASPIVSASFTIAGLTYSFAPDYYADVYTASVDSGFPEVVDTVDDTAGDGAIVGSLTSLAPASLTTSFSDFNTVTDENVLNTAFDDNNNADSIVFTTDSVTVSAAPEPSVWTLMIAGVGLAGFALRRRRTSAFA